jgi:hypothetical protein
MTPKKEDQSPLQRINDLREEDQRRLLDTRVHERNLRKGHLQAEELQAALDALPDVESQAVAIGIPCPSLGREGLTKV